LRSDHLGFKSAKKLRISNYFVMQDLQMKSRINLIMQSEEQQKSWPSFKGKKLISQKIMFLNKNC